MPIKTYLSTFLIFLFLNLGYSEWKQQTFYYISNKEYKNSSYDLYIEWVIIDIENSKLYIKGDIRQSSFARRVIPQYGPVHGNIALIAPKDIEVIWDIDE